LVTVSLRIVVRNKSLAWSSGCLIGHVANIIGRMANSPQLASLTTTLRVYVLVVLATIAALIVMSAVSPHLATDHAWGHAVIVAMFAVLLPIRLRSARAGDRGGLRAVGIISAVLFLVNVVEILIPGFLPSWMRIEMIGVAALTALSVVLVAQIAAQHH
jgi:hypothetical protein